MSSQKKGTATAQGRGKMSTRGSALMDLLRLMTGIATLLLLVFHSSGSVCAQTSRTLEPYQPYVDLHGQVTDVIVGEQIILYLTIANPITSPGMLSVQLTLQVPSGWSVTATGFAQGIGGLWTSTYSIERGAEPRAIGVSILANEPFEGPVTGYVDYYFEGQQVKHREKVTLQVRTAPSGATIASAPIVDSSRLVELSSSNLRWPIAGTAVVIVISILGVLVVKRRRECYF